MNEEMVIQSLFGMVIERLRSKAKVIEVELAGLKAWKVVQEDKLIASKLLQGELDKQVEFLRQVLKDK